MKTTILSITLLVLLVDVTQGYRILGVFAHPAKSNTLFTHAVMSALAARGHQVTVFSHSSPPTAVPNLRHVKVNTSIFGDKEVTITYQDMVLKMTQRNSYCDIITWMGVNKCNSFFNDHQVKELLHSNETYDLVMTLGAFGEECLLALGPVFGAPTIAILPSGAWSTVNYMAGNALSTAQAPEYFDYDFSNRMTFTERAMNLGSTIRRLWLYHWQVLPEQEEVVRSHLGRIDVDIPPLDQLVRNVSLTFVNTHPTVGYPLPATPNIVPIGGITVSADKQPLSQKLQKIMDDAVDGVVYFSLGTIVPVETMPDELIQTYINVFGNLSQSVIWKMPLKIEDRLPENVHLFEWLPQKTILAHPNCKLFITHGGLHSQFETLSAGVPVVGIPFFTDQPYNIRLYEELGVGVGLDLHSLSKHTISSAIEYVLRNASYMENARRVSRIFQDVPLSPAQTVVYWTEYVIRHKGAAHLIPASTRLYWYQRTLLDVIAIIVFIFFLLMRLIMWIYKTLLYIFMFKMFNKISKFKNQ